jgi:hypothetical protein
MLIRPGGAKLRVLFVSMITIGITAVMHGYAWPNARRTETLARPSVGVHAPLQAIAPLYTPRAEIPQRSSQGTYKSWSVFLINNPEWVVAENAERLKQLYDQFQAFGKSIGPDHVAIWFWTQNIWDDPNYKMVDVIRSVALVQKLNVLQPDLKFSAARGPYLFITTEYPGPGLADRSETIFPTSPKNIAYLELNNKGAAEITKLLTQAADAIVSGNISKLNVGSETYWRGMQGAFEAIQSFLSQLTVKFTIKTPFVDTEIK